MKKALLFAAAASLALPLAAGAAKAETVVIKRDNGWHEGWHHRHVWGGPEYRGERVEVRRRHFEPEHTGSVRVYRHEYRSDY